MWELTQVGQHLCFFVFFIYYFFFFFVFPPGIDERGMSVFESNANLRRIRFSIASDEEEEEENEVDEHTKPSRLFDLTRFSDCLQLKELRIHARNISHDTLDRCFRELANAECFPLLEKLDFRNCRVLGWKQELIELISAKKRLKTLKLGYLEEAEMFDRFEYLNIRLVHVLNNCSRLKCLKIYGLHNNFLLDAGFPYNQQIELEKLTLTFRNLENLYDFNISKLKYFNLRGAVNIPHSLFDKAVNLTYVNLSCTSVYPLSLANLLNTATNLTGRFDSPLVFYFKLFYILGLDLCYCSNLQKKQSLTFDLLFQYPHHYSMLGLGGFFEISDQILVQLVDKLLPQCVHIGLGGCPNLTPGNYIFFILLFFVLFFLLLF
jgi:hypothetical protein